METDVLVVGGGIGGGVAAVRAREAGADVTFIDKAYAGKCGASAFALGGFLAVVDPKSGVDVPTWRDWAIGVGEYLTNRDWLEVQIAESYDHFRQLEAWGVPFATENGEVKTQHYGPGVSCVVMRRREFTPALRDRACQLGVKIIDRLVLVDLLRQGGRVVGAVGFHTTTGGTYVFSARATILATGAGGFKAPGTPGDYRTGDGEVAALRAGAEITGKELHNKIGGGYREYPYGCTDAGAGSYTVRRYINALGDEFAGNYAHGPWGRAYFRFSSDIFFEAHAGRAPIYWDLDAISEDARQKMRAHQERSGTQHFAARCGVDLTRGGRLDFFDGAQAGDSGRGCGGTRLRNTKCETTLPGLYAVGDAAGTYLCGSSYNGIGHGLGNAVMTGMHAGESAAAYARASTAEKPDAARLAAIKTEFLAPLTRTGGFSPGWVTQMVQNLMLPYFILQVKQEARLQAALTQVAFLKEHCLPLVRAGDHHELRMAVEVRNMVTNAEMLLRASIFRDESRGSHYREDCPRRRDPEWLAWTVLKQVDGQMALSALPLPRQWWPDLEIPYAERYDWRFPAELADGMTPFRRPE